jgi:glycogen synthase
LAAHPTTATAAHGLRVLLLGPYPPPHGGVEINVAALRDFLLQREVPCEVINLTRHRKAEGHGIFYPSGALQTLRLLVQRKANVLHLHVGGDVSWRLLALALVCSMLPGRRLVLTLHSGGYPSSPAGQTARPFSVRGFVFRRFDFLIGVNREMIEMFVRFGIDRGKTRLILPFALPDRIPDAVLPESILRFLESHNPVLLTVGGLEPEYDLPLQIAALGSFREEYPAAGLVIIGGGSRERDTRDLVASKPYAEHVLLAGDLPHDVTLRAIAEADIFLRTTFYDGDSIAVREAMHFGIPVVATDNGMRPAGVHLTPPRDPAGLLGTIAAIARRLPGCDSASPQFKRDDANLHSVFELYQQLCKRNTAHDLPSRGMHREVVAQDSLHEKAVLQSKTPSAPHN